MEPLDSDEFRKKFREMYPSGDPYSNNETFSLSPGDLGRKLLPDGSADFLVDGVVPGPFLNLNPPMQFPLYPVAKQEAKGEPKMPENLKAWLQQFEPPVERRQKYFLEGIDEGRYHIGPDPLLLHPVQRAEVTGMRRAGIDLTAGHELDALAVAEGVALLLGTRVERAG